MKLCATKEERLSFNPQWTFLFCTSPLIPMSPRLLLALLCTPLLLPAQTTAPSTVPAPAGPGTLPPPAPLLTPEQTATVMKQLEQLETQVLKNRGETLGTALAKFRSALAGQKEAVSLYLDCYKLEHYDRHDLKQTDFQAWKEANEARLKDEEFLAGLMLQLEYLVLTVQAQDVKEQKDMGPIVAQLQTFIPKAVNAVQETMKHTASGAVEQKNQGNGGGGGGGRPGGGGRAPAGGGGRGPGGGGGGGVNVPGNLGNALRQSVKNCEFSNAYLLESHLKREEWAYAPLEIAEIYQSVIFPYYLEVRPTEIAAQWDARINAELALRKTIMSESEFGVFLKERQPELHWYKASYLYSHNVNALQAMADMLKIIRENPTHPEAGAWLRELRDAVNMAQPGRPTANPSAVVPPASP